MADKKNRYITVAYKLYSDNEQGIHEIFEEAPEAHPFQFNHRSFGRPPRFRSAGG